MESTGAHMDMQTADQPLNDVNEVPTAPALSCLPDGQLAIEFCDLGARHFKVRGCSIGGVTHVRGRLVRRSRDELTYEPLTIVIRDENAMALTTALAAEFGMRLFEVIEAE
jgi:hypothetical protein